MSMRIFVSLRAVVAATCFVACGSTTASNGDAGTDAANPICGAANVGAGTSSVTGTIAGKGIAAVDAIAFVGTNVGSSQGLVSYVGFSLSNVSGTCVKLQGAHVLGAPLGVANAATMTAFVFAKGAADVGPGTYAVSTQSDPPTANALITADDSACVSVASEYGTGSITLTKVSCTTVEGSFDIQFTDAKGALNDHVSGSFSAPVCNADALAGRADDAGLGAPACSP